MTLLLTDIEGSTLRWEANPDAMRRALAHHDALLRGVIEAAKGRVLKGMGDGLWGVFEDATAAVMAAVEAQRVIAEAQWTGVEPLRIRVGLHTARAVELEERGGDLFGPPLNRCARLLELTHSGQILATESVRAGAKGLPDAIAFRDLGTHRLRDLREPEHIHQVLHPALTAAFPPLDSLDTYPHNLPVQRTSFVGRDADVREVAALVSSERLVCLTGVGGAGKTRLALAVAAEMLEVFSDGVWVVDLAGLRESELVPHVIATTLGIRDTSAQPVADTLAEFLADRDLLLLLDNCEHLVGTCARLAHQLLRAGRGLRILATSRERLDVPGEAVWGVAPLSLAPNGDGGDAVTLFLDRMRMAAPDIATSDVDLAAISSICRRLDGIPLALELAAARLSLLSPHELLARLDDRLQVLKSGARTAVPHHQTLRATLDWSYDLLDRVEQRLFRRVAVFAGPVGFPDIERVVIDEVLPKDALFDGLDGLVSKSLVTVQRSPDGTRYGMLETVREYGRERLASSGEAAAMHDAHADWALDASELARGRPPPEASENVPVNDADVRAALRWLEDTRPSDAVELASRFANIWWVRGQLAEGRAHLERTVSHCDEDLPGGLRARALTGLATLAVSMGDLSAADAYAEQVLAAGGRYRSDVVCLWVRGTVSWAKGDLESSQRYHEEGLRLARELGFDNGSRFHLEGRARVHRTEGELDRAQELYEEQLAAFSEDADPTWVAGTLDGLARVAYLRGDDHRSGQLAREALAHYRSGGYREGIASALTIAGLASAATGHLEEAKEALLQAIDLYLRMGHRGGLAGALEAAATLAVGPRGGRTAAHLLGGARAIRAGIGEAPMGEEPRLLRGLEDRLRGLLGDDFAALVDEGLNLDLDASVELARSVLSSAG